VSALEKHFRIREIAALWHLSTDKVRQIFDGVPGVLRIGAPESRNKRKYFTLLVPQSVVERVHAALRSKAEAK
jgi:hypothetical protein